MNRFFTKAVSIAMGLTMLTGAAMADSVSFNGNVIASCTEEVYAPIGGTVGSVSVKAGQQVEADTVLCTLKTTRVYASQSGTVTGIFGEEGDSADSVTNNYGGILYIQPTNRYVINGSTEEAYNSSETKYVDVGETVYLSTRTGVSQGQGVITSVNGSSYTVEVTSGEFQMDGSVDIYRKSSCKSGSRVGRGTVSRRSPNAVTASGTIVSMNVKNGDVVKRGDLLFETLDGTYDGAEMPGKEITAGVSGVVYQVNAQQGGSVTKGGVVAVIYPNDSMQIEGTIYESDLSDLAVGDHVTIEMNWNEDDDITYDGVVSMISANAETTAGDSVCYKVYVDFTPDKDTRFGMSVTVTGKEDEAAASATAAAEDEDEDDEDEEEAEEAEETGKPSGMPEGFEPPAGFDGQLPEGFEPPAGFDGQLPSGTSQQ